MSFQSLNEPFLRSSRIFVAIAGPMPLTAFQFGLGGLVDVDGGKRNRSEQGQCSGQEFFQHRVS